MLDKETKQNLEQYLALIESPIVFSVSLDNSENSQKLAEFTKEIAEMSPKISWEKRDSMRTPSFSINPVGKESGIVFAGIPLGHEFSSFLLAMLQISGRAPKISESLSLKIKKITQTLHFDSYVSLTCHNCPDVVQALNILAVLNPNITHTMIEGGMFQKEIDDKKIMAVPTVFLNGEEFSSGRMTIEQIVEKITGPLIEEELVADSFGGQVVETLGIENMIGTSYTEGPKLMQQVESHVRSYPIDIMMNQQAVSLNKEQHFINIGLANGISLKAKTAIIATGAHWRSINVPGEKEFKNKGIAYCPHCDGPLFKGKEIAVIGGGNSGVEAAIDLAGLAKHVYVLEFLPELKADQILQDKLVSLANVTVIKHAATKEISGTNQVESLSYIDRRTMEMHTLAVSGVFILVGLLPNTDWLDGTIEMNPRNEIVTEKNGATNIPGVFAAGDCTDSPYKQIIVSMGSGATAALGAFDYLMRT
ncbi:TPA: alkyl hydroperoxide reductase subunit F [Enterococcus faecium]